MIFFCFDRFWIIFKIHLFSGSDFLIFFFRRGVGGLPSSRLMKARGSVAPGDDSSLPDDTVDSVDESEK